MIQEKIGLDPQIVVLGNKWDLNFRDFLVLFEGKAVKCMNLLEAVDVAFKSFYIFNIEFSNKCFGAWQFLDIAIYNMKPTCVILSAVKELSAFVCSDT